MNMRLTVKKDNGEWNVKGVNGKVLNWSEVPRELYGALCKLKDYEDICDDPNKLEDMVEIACTADSKKI